MSLHVMRAIAVAKSKGAMAGDPEALPIWELTKRELVELVLRLTDAGVYAETKDAVLEAQKELEILRSSGIV